ncbi:MAG: cytochrome c biogenesis protein ResB [Desulfobacterales bacterium]
MSTKEIAADPFTKIWKFFASVRLTIVLLLTLAATSIIGTLIPQNQSPDDYVNAFGAFVYRLFDVLGLIDLYHSWWFQTLMLMLAVNVLVCSIERLSVTWRIIFDRHPKFNISRFRRLQQQEEFTADGPAEQLKKGYQSIISRHFRFQRVEETENGFAIFAEKGRWTRIGVYIVHLSVILMLVGAVIGSIFGFEGFVNIAEGDSVQRIRLRNSSHMLDLDFAIRCDDFDVSFYDTGAPEEFRSSLTILEQGKPVLSKDIIVNDPLHYKGISIFQSSYGELPAQKQDVQISDDITLSFTSKASGMIYEKKARIGQPIKIPENLGKFVIDEFRNAFNFRGQDLGAAIVGTLHQTNGVTVEVVLPVKFPSFDKMGPIFNQTRKDDVIISVADINANQTRADVRYYTGLQVAHDPGVWVVYSGFIFMIIGCYITFFMSHRQICVDIHASGDKCRIMVAGTANKNKLANERKVKKIAHILVNDGR